MTWAPNVTVTLAGTVETGSTVGLVSVRRGREDILTVPSPGQCRLTLLDPSSTPEVGQQVVVTVDDSSATAQTVFTGKVENVDMSARPTASGTPMLFWNIVASGTLARANRRRVLASGRSAEKDGTRVAAALEEALSTSWETWPSDSWADTDVSLTWEDVDADAFDASIIDTPGLYDLVALDAATGGHNPLTVVRDAGESAFGVLYETGAGTVGYADADRRATNAEAGFLEIPSTAISEDGVRLSKQLVDLSNRVFVDWDGGTVTAEDADSISTPGRGLFVDTVSTALASEAQAQVFADKWITDRAAPKFRADAVAVVLSRASDALLDALLGVDANLAVEFTGLPAGSGVTRFAGFVEGFELTVTQTTGRMALWVSAAKLSIGPVRWSRVSSAIAWDDVDVALEWADADEVVA